MNIKTHILKLETSGKSPPLFPTLRGKQKIEGFFLGGAVITGVSFGALAPFPGLLLNHTILGGPLLQQVAARRVLQGPVGEHMQVGLPIEL